MDQHDFNRGILDEVAHRPWPMPDSPWVMTQTWNDLLFAHWPVDKAALGRLIPGALELDLFNGEAWLGIVPFHMTNVAPRGLPALPWVSEFPELNVRTYVTVAGRPGVYFFSLDAANPLAVGMARTLFHLPYFLAEMHVGQNDPALDFSSRRKSDSSNGCDAALEVSYRPAGDTFRARHGTLEYFLTERYCLYTVDEEGHALRVNVHHPPWPLQAATAAFRINSMAAANGVRLPSVAPLLHFAKRQDMVAWLPEAVTAEVTKSA